MSKSEMRRKAQSGGSDSDDDESNEVECQGL
jgi:hypothetical protein